LSSKKKEKFKEEASDMAKKKQESETLEATESISVEEAENKTIDEAITEGESTLTEEKAEAKTEETPQLETLKAEYDELNDKFLRLTAEFANYRKRVEKEKNDIFKFGNEKMMVEMLPIMDNFERALSSVVEEHADDKVLDGVKLIKKSLDDFFEKHGVKKIESLNAPFDPDKHHAVMSEESDEHDDETVIEVFQEGYVLNDKVIRPSMVKVTK
jgi:molecular chaperone GrpE